MEVQMLFNIVATACGALISWVMKGIKDDIRDQGKASRDIAIKVQAIEVLVAGEYVRNEDLKDLGDTLFNKLDRIESKVDKKMDKV